MSTLLNTLTDFEVAGLHSNFCLADGHAYQDLHPKFVNIVQSLPQIWRQMSELSIPEAEQSFNQTYASFIRSPLLKNYTHFRICPTASNSIDLIGAILNQLRLNAVLIEPTFDNLALLVKRRGVPLTAISDTLLFVAAEADDIDKTFPQLKNTGALFIVHPNNPNGIIMSENAYKNIAYFCKKHNILMVVDNCFRVYRRTYFDDYKILIESGVSFIGFEDTGKVWPTQDMKASLIYFSEDLDHLFNELYNEVYLCVSNFTLGILSDFITATQQEGLDKTIWKIVDQRRDMVRKIIKQSTFSTPEIAMNSKLPVEWLIYSADDKNDLAICQELKQLNLAVLPGRQFFWNSSHHKENQKYIRVSLMKREAVFLTGLDILNQYTRSTLKYIYPSSFEMQDLVPA